MVSTTEIGARNRIEERYQIAIESANQGLWDIDFESGENYHSPQWFELRGFQPTELWAASYDCWIERVHPDDKDILLKQFKDEKAGVSLVLSREYRERHKAGHYIWVLSRGKVVARRADGTALRVIGTDTDITEIRVLADREQRWRIAVESAGQGLWDVNHATGATYYSREWYHIRGMEPGVIKSVTVEDYLKTVHPDDRERFCEENRLKEISGVDSTVTTYRTRHADGRWIWILSRGRVSERDANGVPVRTIGTDTDITAIKESHENALRLAHTEMRWRNAVESAGQGVWDYDLVSGERYNSELWFSIRGYSPADRKIVGFDAWMARIHPNDVGQIRKAVEDQSNGCDSINLRYRERHADGHYIWILGRGCIAERNSDGTPKRVIGTDTDITEIKAAEEKLQALADSERRWRIAVESAGQGLWDINNESGENYFSDAWRTLRGLGTEEPEPNTSEAWFDTVHPDDREKLRREFDARKTSVSDLIEHEYRQRRKDGTWLQVLSRGKIVKRDNDGNVLRMIGVDTDVSALKKFTDDLRRLADRHDHAVSTAEIGVWEHDLVANMPLWDKKTRELFSCLQPDSPVTPGVWEISLHPEDRDKTIAIASRAIKSKGSFSIDYRIVLPEGGVRHIRSRASYYEDKATGPRMLGVCWDVTHDYKAAAEIENAYNLAENRNRLLESARKEMEFSALHDALTGLDNRRSLDVKLESLSTVKGATARAAVLHMDLDRFKQINDTLGHAAGDTILLQVARALRECTPPGAFIARAGGDEFVVVIDDAPADAELKAIAKQIVRRMRQPVDFNGHQCLFGASIGIAAGSGEALDGKQLLVNADIALYKAKNEGRNQWSFFTSQMQVQITAHKNTADDILRALDRKEFFACYQLQFCARTHEVTGVEALVRWRHPERGLLTPDKFLQVAEDINAVARIDEQVLAQALADMETWRAGGVDIPLVSVNVSAKRLSDEKLIERLRGLHIPEGKVSFELLESIYLDDQSNTIAGNIDAIRKMGIGIEIDDFGTGHASIACLLSLRPNRFKIDRSLIKPILASVPQRRLVASIVDIGRSLHIEVVAEGVETMEHARVLKDLDCDYLQGYGLAKPMEASAILEYVTNKRWQKAA